MKIAKKTFKNLGGSALLITVVITGVITLAMASYLSMVSGQYRLTMRSQEWNAAIPITEAGIEEAMAHLNKNCVTNGINVDSFDPDEDYWNPIGGAEYQKTNYLADGSYYIATVNLTDPHNPKIDCEGYTLAPLTSLKPLRMFATIGGDNEVAPGKAPYLKRKVHVTTRIIPVFTHALAADKDIVMNGKVQTDSFNSTNGLYNPSNVSDNGDVATNSDLKDDDTEFGISNGTIRGTLSIGPGGDGAEIGIGPNGVVGNNEYIDGGGEGIQDGRWNDDMNVKFEDVEEPFPSGAGLPPGGDHDIITIGYTTNVVASCVCAGGNNCCTPDGEGGIVSPLSAQATTGTYPAFGTYVGSVSTNWTQMTSASYPGGTVRNLVTNSVSISTNQAPSAGTFVGSVVETIEDVKSKTEPSIYVDGTLEKKGAWYYFQVKMYHYQHLAGYTYEKLTSYTYAQITGYQRFDAVPYTTTNTVTFDHIFTGGDYKISSLSGNVLIKGDSVIYCTGSFSAGMLQIVPGKSLKLYVGGDVSLAGNQKINQNGYAKDLSLYGLPSCKNISIGGNAEFTGTIYAPQAHLHMHGGGNDRKDVFGAIIVGSAKLNGHMNFHYDEDLKNSGPARGFIANSWREE